MDNAERLDLAVRAQLSAIRANQAHDRTALPERHYVPVARVIEAYVEVCGSEY